jgi:hypothetical protein
VQQEDAGDEKEGLDEAEQEGKMEVVEKEDTETEEERKTEATTANEDAEEKGEGEGTGEQLLEVEKISARVNDEASSGEEKDTLEEYNGEHAEEIVGEVDDSTGEQQLAAETAVEVIADANKNCSEEKMKEERKKKKKKRKKERQREKKKSDKRRQAAEKIEKAAEVLLNETINRKEEEYEGQEQEQEQAQEQEQEQAQDSPRRLIVPRRRKAQSEPHRRHGVEVYSERRATILCSSSVSGPSCFGPTTASCCRYSSGCPERPLPPVHNIHGILSCRRTCTWIQERKSLFGA